MKTLNRFSFLMLMLFFSVAGIAQSGTTMEEFNYVTKGLKIQLDSGLDMKKGYEIVPLDTLIMKIPHSSYQEYSGWELSQLMRVNDDNREIAAYIIRYGIVYEGKTPRFESEYYCIARPNSSEEVINTSRYHLSSKVTGSDRLHAIVFLLGSAVVWDEAQ